MTVESLKTSLCILGGEQRVTTQWRDKTPQDSFEHALLNSASFNLGQAVWCLNRLVEFERQKERQRENV